MNQLPKIKLRLPFIHSIYMKIAEPRVRRLMYFGIYGCLLIAGIGSYIQPPKAIERMEGGDMITVIFCSLIAIGSLLSLVSVLPGIWWLERTGIVAIATGIMMYGLILFYLNGSFLVTMLPFVVTLICALRWLDIKEYLLAPREG